MQMNVIEATQKIFTENGIDTDVLKQVFAELDNIPDKEIAKAHAISLLSRWSTRCKKGGMGVLANAQWPTLNIYIKGALSN